MIRSSDFLRLSPTKTPDFLRQTSQKNLRTIRSIAKLSFRTRECDYSLTAHKKLVWYLLSQINTILPVSYGLAI